jgi:hypothetical protein
MIPRSIQIVVALVVLLTGACGVRSLIAQFGILDHPPSVAGVKEAVDIEFVDIIPQDFRNFRATKCNVMASINNATQYRINDLAFHVGNGQFRVDVRLDASQHLDRWYVGSIDLTDINSTCADQALYILNNVAHTSPSACAADGLSQEECRSLVRISTRMGPQAIAGIRYDESEAGKRRMAAIEAEIPSEISFITDQIDDKRATAEGQGGIMTNDVVVLHDTTTRYYVDDGPQSGWHFAPYKKCSRLSILNKGGLAALHASTAQSADAYRDIPSGYVWYAQATSGSVWYGQVKIADIAPSIFVAKCDMATGFAELELPAFHSDGTLRVVK